ncbi:conserved hypothetical protein [Frankia sp. Hr75.2]|nr:conserved hypothetical protein [Frankia sp. Hr75.2]
MGRGADRPGGVLHRADRRREQPQRRRRPGDLPAGAASRLRRRRDHQGPVHHQGRESAVGRAGPEGPAGPGHLRLAGDDPGPGRSAGARRPLPGLRRPAGREGLRRQRRLPPLARPAAPADHRRRRDQQRQRPRLPGSSSPRARARRRGQPQQGLPRRSAARRAAHRRGPALVVQPAHHRPHSGATPHTAWRPHPPTWMVSFDSEHRACLARRLDHPAPSRAGFFLFAINCSAALGHTHRRLKPHRRDDKACGTGHRPAPTCVPSYRGTAGQCAPPERIPRCSPKIF